MTHKIVICIQCRASVNHAQLRAHVMKYHKDMKPPLDLDDKLSSIFRQHCLDLIHPPVHPKSCIPPIFGLAPPLDRYLVCDQCHHGFARDESDDNPSDTRPSKSFAAHKCSAQVNPKTFTISSVQRFRPNKSSSWFAVETYPQMVTQSSRWAQYQAEILARPNPDQMVAVPDNHRILHQFLGKERWIEHVKGKNIKNLVALVSLSRSRRNTKIHSQVFEFLKYHQSLLVGTYMRRFLGTRPKYVPNILGDLIFLIYVSAVRSKFVNFTVSSSTEIPVETFGDVYSSTCRRADSHSQAILTLHCKCNSHASSGILGKATGI
jgi:hypothetical protein